MSPPPALSAEDAVALAPDASSRNAARSLAGPSSWPQLGADERALWGACKGSAQNPYAVAVDLEGPAFRCSCPSRKHPCKHGLALLLLHAQAEGDAAYAVPPEREVEHEPPAWVAEWIAGREGSAERVAARKERGGEPVDPEAAARRVAAREAKVAAGVDELERWLHDLVRAGLASAQARPYSFWENAAARMVDAQATGLARLVRGAAGSAVAGPEPLLERLGLLQLALTGARRVDELPDGLRDEVRRVIGYTQSQDEIRAGEGVEDRWACVAQRVVDDERLRMRRSWMAGLQTGRRALVLEFAFGMQPFDPRLQPGGCFDGKLAFFAGAQEQRAILQGEVRRAPWPEEPPGDATIADGLGAYAAALAASPWADRAALLLRAVTPVRRADGFAVRDADGAQLALSCQPGDGWALVALAGGDPIWLCGEWDGRRLTPLSASVDGRVVSLGAS
jgi:hypothetical protein